jgi:acyl-coenzyme A thioesterase PaaI-like protein
MTERTFQAYYPENLSHCYGCGTLNDDGLHIESRWDGEESVCHFEPQLFHLAVPGYVYGGLIASLVDCHGTGTAAAAKFRDEGRAMDTEPAYRFVTASLHVDYLKPTPLGPLELRGSVVEVKGRKVTVDVRVLTGNKETARGTVIAVQIPDEYMR